MRRRAAVPLGRALLKTDERAGTEASEATRPPWRLTAESRERKESRGEARPCARCMWRERERAAGREGGAAMGGREREGEMSNAGERKRGSNGDELHAHNTHTHETHTHTHTHTGVSHALGLLQAHTRSLSISVRSLGLARKRKERQRARGKARQRSSECSPRVWAETARRAKSEQKSAAAARMVSAGRTKGRSGQTESAGDGGRGPRCHLRGRESRRDETEKRWALEHREVERKRERWRDKEREREQREREGWSGKGKGVRKKRKRERERKTK